MKFVYLLLGVLFSSLNFDTSSTERLILYNIIFREILYDRYYQHSSFQYLSMTVETEQ